MRKIRLLLVEDDPDHRDLITAALQSASPDTQVVTADTRDLAIDAVRRHRFDCIVLDFNLPPYTAADIAQDIRAAAGDIPIVVVSSSTDQRVVIESMRSGVSNFVPKADAIVGDNLWRSVQRVVKTWTAQLEERRTADRRLANLRMEADTDELTGMKNRRFAARLFESDRLKNQRRRNISCVMIDIDHFKLINDTHGHSIGDDALRHVADVVQEHCDIGDIAIRWGGEEFMVLKLASTLCEASVWADRVRAAIASSSREASVSVPPMTASFGVTTLQSHDLSIESTSQADEALYLAKESGRNRVATWPMVEVIQAAKSLAETSSSDNALARTESLLSHLNGGLGFTQRDQTGPHGTQVRKLAVHLGRSLGYSVAEVSDLAYAATFHDIGKIGVPEQLLSLPRRLDASEQQMVDHHTWFGSLLLETLGFPPRVTDAVAGHHMRFDDDSAVKADKRDPASFALLIGLADAMVTMTSERPYASPKSLPDAISELKRERGHQFAPWAVDSLVDGEEMEFLAELQTNEECSKEREHGRGEDSETRSPTRLSASGAMRLESPHRRSAA